MLQLYDDTLVFRAHSSTRYSLAALLGAVETDSRLTGLRIFAPLELSLSEISDYLDQGRVIVAQSVMSTQVDRVVKETTRLRNRFGKDITLIAGGAHATVRPKELLEIGFDYVVIGEGEKTFPDLLWNIVNDKDGGNIEGVVSDTTDKVTTPREQSRVILDDYPPFALGMNVVGPIEVTRGCPFSCKFCSTPFLSGGIVRHRSIDSIVYWLERAVNESGFNRTWLLSPNALCYGGRGRKVVYQKLEELLKSVTSIEGLEEVFFGSFPSEVRPEFVSRPVLEMFRTYVTNKTLQIGLQSGSNRVLQAINRQHTVEDGLNAISIALDTDFVPHVDMIFGLPTETKEELNASIDLCLDLVDMGTKVHGHVFMPLPGSAFQDMPPGRLDPDSRRVLGELSRKKLLTGSWSHQEKLAKILSERRRCAIAKR